MSVSQPVATEVSAPVPRPEGDAPPRPRYFELEAFRGLAALAVVLFHAYQFARVDGVYPYAGLPPDRILHQLDGSVAMFLALSGFLLYQPVATAVLAGTAVRGPGTFLARRAVRVVPLYIVAVLVVWGLRTPSLEVGWSDLLSHLTFTHVFFASHVFSLIGPAWSLAVEVHCYLLIALLLPFSGAVARRAAPRWRAAWVLGVPAVLTGVSVAYKAWALGDGVPLDRFEVWFATPARLDNFTLGMLLGAAVALRPGRLPGWVAVGFRLGGLAVAVAAAFWRVPGTWGDAFFSAVMAVAAVLLLAGSVLGPREGAWVRALSWRPMALLGLWSYSLYLWQEPVTQWLGDRGWLSATSPFWLIATAFVSVAVVCGFLSYWVIEYPTSHLKFLLKGAASGTSTSLAPAGGARARRVTPPAGAAAASVLASPVAADGAPDGDQSTGAAPRLLSGRGEHVLVVDDDDLMVALVSAALEQEGYRVTTADDGQAALAAVEEELPAFIISDVNMPGLDGFSLLARVRSDSRTRWVPVLLLTTRREVADVVEGLALGADDYLTKPFAVPELLARLRAKLDRPPVPADLLPIDRETGLLSRGRFDEELFRELGRAGRGGRPGIVAVIGLSELAGLELRLGRAAGESTLRQISAALQAVLRPLDIVARIDSGHLGVLMPETTPAEAAARLRAASSRVAALAIEVGAEHLRVTPSAGYATFADGDDPETLVARATVALEYATAHLDLLPQRWVVAMDDAVRAQRAAAAALRSGPRRARAWRRRLRTPAQIAASLVIGLVLPFLAYWRLDRAGLDITWLMYIAVVVSLAVTGGLIWIEGLLALRVEDPPEAPGEPYPPATAIIAAYLPNEAATVFETVEAFLLVDYPAPLQVILAYNTPEPMAIEVALRDFAAEHPGFVAFRVENSTSKAQNVNAALALAEGAFVGVFDADHHPDPGSFTRAWRWLSNGYDVVQGHCLVRNGSATRLARMIAVEFEAIYAVSHPGRARLHDFAIFGGSNGYWRTDLLHEIRMRGSMLTEDIDSSLRVLESGGRVRSDSGLVSRELATTTLRQVWNQRMRWAQGWFQVSLHHLRRGLRSKDLTLRQKLGLIHLLGWREFYPWLSLQMFPVVAYWIWRGDALDWRVPIFVVTSVFTVSVGPVQTYFAYRLADPEIARHRRWFLAFMAFNTVFYTEYKNVIGRVAQIKEFTGERDWRVTPRSAPVAAAPEPPMEEAPR